MMKEQNNFGDNEWGCQEFGSVGLVDWQGSLEGAGNSWTANAGTPSCCFVVSVLVLATSAPYSALDLIIRVVMTTLRVGIVGGGEDGVVEVRWWEWWRWGWSWG